jgi:hypothetical protein
MLPDFLCIGAQKAGTTWLYRNIKHHPNIWVPPIKEIHYFDHPTWLPLIVSVYRTADLVSLRNITKRLSEHKQPKHKQYLGWYLRYLLFPRNDPWYKSLFAPGPGEIAGDITPDYATLKESRVARIHALVPEAKIIYILRNPIQRAWSQANMRHKLWKEWGIESIKGQQIDKYLDKRRRSGHSAYIQNLATWGRFFPERQLRILFFDQLAQDSRSFLKGVYQFLDVDDSDEFVPETVYEKRNVGQQTAIPKHLTRYLADQYHEQIEQLHQRFDNHYTASWLDSANEYLRA